MIPITLMMAVSADGRIAKNQSQLVNWTSPEDKKLFVAESKKHGVIIMGNNTFKTLPAPLPGRLNIVFSHNTKEGPANVKYVSGKPETILLKLEKMGYKSALLGGGNNLNSLFLKHKLISEIILTIEPIIFGSGLPLFDNDSPVRLHLKSLKKLNENTFMAHYLVDYK